MNKTHFFGAVLAAYCINAQAQVATPFYTPEQFMAGMHSTWLQPNAQNFAHRSKTQTQNLRDFCSSKNELTLKQLQQNWRSTLNAWDYLSTVAIGPLIERRSARQIDFMPTRPASIKQAISNQPNDESAMQSIGSPAKGLPALEWLLWAEPLKSNTPACNYAIQVAADIEREARQLADAIQKTAPQPIIDSGEDISNEVRAQGEKASKDMSEVINQWIGGLERLRWANLEKPLRSAQAKNSAPDYPRNLSQSTQQSWLTQWIALRDLARENPPKGNSADSADKFIALETYLKSRGLLRLAKNLQDLLASTDASMQKVNPKNSTTVLQAALALAKLKQFSEQDMASALQVNIGFSDADGD